MTFQSLLQPQTSRTLRWTIRLTFIGIAILIFWLIRHFLDIGRQYSAGTYFSHSAYNFWHSLPEDERPAILTETNQKGDKIVVIGKLEAEDTAWVEEYLPEYTFRSSLLSSVNGLLVPLYYS